MHFLRNYPTTDRDRAGNFFDERRDPRLRPENRTSGRPHKFSEDIHMTFKKGLLAAATATTVAIAGTGIANAQEDDLPTDVGLSTESSLEGVDLSDQAGGLFGSVADGQFDLGTGIAGLAAFVAAGGAVAGSISLLPNINDAIKDFQEFADEVRPPLPF